MATHVRLFRPQCWSVMASKSERSGEAWGFLMVACELLGERAR